MPDAHRRHVLELARGHSVDCVDFVDDAASYVQAADVVVSMGGYNSVCELLSLGKAALVVPRVRPRREQLIRARLLSRLGLLRMIDPGELSPERVLGEMNALLANPHPPPRLPMRGLPSAADAVDELLLTEARPLTAAGSR
jgi:predicted glycosyltransferase